MPGHVIAAQMVRETTRRHIAEPPPPRRPRRVRRRAARVLHAAAYRLDPAVTTGPRLGA